MENVTRDLNLKYSTSLKQGLISTNKLECECLKVLFTVYQVGA